MDHRNVLTYVSLINIITHMKTLVISDTLKKTI